MIAPNIQEWLLEREDTAVAVKSREWEAKFLQLISHGQDLHIEIMLRILALSWITSPFCPDDAIEAEGRGRSMPRWPNEDILDYAIRISKAFNYWYTVGGKGALQDELRGYGYDGAFVVGTNDWGVMDNPLDPGNPLPGWTGAQTAESEDDQRIWIYIPFGSHTATPAATFGDGTVFGDGTLFGIGGLKVQELDDIRLRIRDRTPLGTKVVSLTYLMDNANFDGAASFAGSHVSLDMSKLI